MAFTHPPHCLSDCLKHEKHLNIENYNLLNYEGQFPLVVIKMFLLTTLPAPLLCRLTNELESAPVS